MSITLSAGESRNLGTIYLTPVVPEELASVYGTVVRADTGAVLPGVLVEVGTAYAGYTNSAGYFEITNIEPGTYTVRFSLAGYETVTI